jgi:2-polyprenyl-3-methyl-5-hydroxy-6-metoxy-1,4-benzoquinol methylase
MAIEPTCKACGADKHQILFSCSDFWVSKENFDIAVCHNCGLGYTVNAPSESEIGRYYQHADYVSHSDTREGIFFKVYHAVREYMLGRKRKMVEQSVRGKSLLDVGAGTAYFISHMQTNGWQVEGVEPDAGARANALNNSGINLKAKLEEVASENQTFSAITMWHVLEHVHQPETYFQTFRKLLSSDGRLIIAVPNHSSFDAGFYGKHWAAWDVPKHLWHFTPAAMYQFAQNNGFEVESKRMLPFDPFYIAMLSEKIAGNFWLSYTRGPLVGLVSFLMGVINKDKASSVVYTLKMKETVS